MNLLNIAKHLLYLTQMEFAFEDTKPSADEIFASQQLFKILKTFKDSYFNELHSYQTLDFHDEYDAMTDEEESTDEDENQSSEFQNNFTLEGMQHIVEWLISIQTKKLHLLSVGFEK